MRNSHESARSVVITGLGIVSPLGIGVEPFWEKLSRGESGIGPIEMLAYSAAPHNVGGEVKDFTEKSARSLYLKQHRKSIKLMCREIQLAAASAMLALENSALGPDEVDHDRLGVEFGANLMFSPPQVLQDACKLCLEEETGYEFQFDQWGAVGLTAMEPLWLLRYLPNMPACHIGIFADARGPNNSITLEEASGNLAVGEAQRVITRGDADVIIAGTTGTRLHPVKTIHAALWDQLANSDDDPTRWCRPFELNRRGQVIGEGACSFILEEESHAQSRKATIWGRVLGYGSSCVADRNGSPRIREAAANAMRSALRDAGLKPEDIGHVNAHGLATRESDVEEAQAIRDVFGDYADEVPVTALKGYFGNSGSGCGTLEMAGSLLGLRHGVIPRTLNYESPDPECPLNVVAGEARPVQAKTVMNVNFTRMGQASALIVTG